MPEPGRPREEVGEMSWTFMQHLPDFLTDADRGIMTCHSRDEGTLTMNISWDSRLERSNELRGGDRT